MLRIMIGIALCILPIILFAQGQGEGLGDVADTMVEPIDIAGHLLTDATLIAGLVCLVAGFFRYMQHRINPLAHPLSTVIALLSMGTVFVLFPVIYKKNEQPEEQPKHAVSGVQEQSGTQAVPEQPQSNSNP